jgi:peptidylprolyl isomerase
MDSRRLASFLALLIALPAALASAPQNARLPLSAGDIASITRLVMLEDRRELDEAAITQALRADHPEVRRRAAMAIGRIARSEAGPWLSAARADADAAVAGAVAFATGQLRDPAGIPWLEQVLSSPATTPDVAREAARSLGKFAVPEARAALARYLSRAPDTQAAAPPVGEALLSIGRFSTRDDLGPILRWTKTANPELRWRAAWALFRPRNPAAVAELLRLSADSSAEVRYWSMRGLAPIPAGRGRGGAPPAIEPSPVDPSRLAARLRAGVRDGDRRVRTEALRALAQYDDDESFKVVVAALDSGDSWMSVSAAESLGRFQGRRAIVVPRLIAATQPAKPLALRITALAPLALLAPEAALDAAASLAREANATARNAARQALNRLGDPGRARLDALVKEIPAFAPPATGGAGPPSPPPAARSADDYRTIVDRWIVTDFNGAPKPRAILETSKGRLEVELNPGDAPLGVEYFVAVVTSGEIVNTEFGRVVPNFVAQQRAIRTGVRLRDEVSRLGLLRGTLSWASAGLDTGNPGYTFGSTPQPHNEGNFTALGRVVAGMDVVDRLEQGDRITGARMKQD